MPHILNRRTFLKRTVLALGVTTLACSGLTVLASRQPNIQLIETLENGEDRMNQKILVTYASRAGSTAEVAQAIADELNNRGLAVDLRPVVNVSSLADYSAVVIGSAVRMGSWLPDAVKFVELNQATLNKMPTAFFVMHLMNLGNDDVCRMARLAYLDPVRKLVKPHFEAFFAGVGDMNKVSFLERMIGKMVKSPEGDFRDWDAIRGWARSIL